jgi:hypothetical protein
MTAGTVRTPRAPRGAPADRLTPAQGRRFGLTVGGAFLVLAGVFWWRQHWTLAAVAAALGGALALSGVLLPTRLGPVERAWMGLALRISKITTPIFMAVVYFLVITPTALLRRAAGRNAIRRAPRAPSHWVARPPGAGRRSDLERQF